MTNELLTVGSLVRKPKFVILSVITILSVVTVFTCSIGGYWPVSCRFYDGTLFIFVGMAYTMAIASVTYLISWVLVDDCSWFLKASILSCTSMTYIFGGIIYLHTYFRVPECLSHCSPQSDIWSNESIILSCYPPGFQTGCAAWTRGFVIIWFCEGIVYFLFTVYLFVSLDE